MAHIDRKVYSAIIRNELCFVSKLAFTKTRSVVAMKKWIVLVFMVALLSAMADTWTDPATGITWAYTVIGDEVQVGSGAHESPAIPWDTAGSITIPSMLGGKPVTSIGDYAFYGCSMTSVTIPDGVVSIGEDAFRSSGLTSVVVPSSMTSIGDYAFFDCRGLTSVTIPEGVTSIGHSAFYECRQMMSAMIPSSVTSIGGDAFGRTPFYDNLPDGIIMLGGGVLYKFKGQCPSSITIPDDVKSIGDYAFMECTGLSSVSIPSNVTSIGNSAFYGCSGLSSVTIPSNVTSVGSWAFDGTPFYDNLPDGMVILGGGVLYRFKGECPSSVTIPEGVTSVGDWAFASCNGLTSVTIPKGVTIIGNNAFYDCSGLTKVTLPESVTRIGCEAFSYCSDLMEVAIPEGVTSIGDGAFSYCCCLTSATIPAGVSSIGNFAFYWCNRMSSVTIPDGVMSIGSSAFSYCNMVKSVTLPGSLISIGDGAFEHCSGLKSVTIPSKVTSMGYCAFASCSDLRSVTFSNGMTSIGDYAFWDCSELTSVAIPSSVLRIGEGAFLDCPIAVVFVDGDISPCVADYFGERKQGFYQKSGDEIKYYWEYTFEKGVVSITGVSPAFGDIIIPEELGDCPVTSVGGDAFFGCSGLTSVKIPDGVTSIRSYAFSCSGLTSVTIPSSVTHVGSCAFDGCNGLESVRISDLSAWCRIEFASATANPVSYSHKLFLNDEEVCDLVIPEDVIAIRNDAFYGWSRLKSVMIASSVTNIGNRAFYACSGLTSVMISEGVTRIGDSAFCCCYGLRKVTIPSSVTSIGDDAFYGCGELTTATIPPSVTKIGNRAFCGCRGLTSVTILPSVRSIGMGAFDGCSALMVVYVGNGDVGRVKGLYTWPGNIEFVEIASPSVWGDWGAATVSGDPVRGFVIKPHEKMTVVEVLSIPDGIDARQVTVEVSPKVKIIVPNGANVKVVRGADDITAFLDIPAEDENGIIDLTKAAVKKNYVEEVLDPEMGAVIDLNAANPKLTTTCTRKGLFYQLREGGKIGDMQNSDSIVGNGKPWSPTITVKGGESGFYSIDVKKGE